jgi:hypothetical protein
MLPLRFAPQSRGDPGHSIDDLIGHAGRVRKQPRLQLEPVHLELSDETFIAADRSVVAAIVADPGRWAEWWPDLQLTLLRDRGPKGCQWQVSAGPAGTVEIYLEPWHDGTLLHLFLRLELPAGRVSAGQLHRAARDRTLSWKRRITGLKDELEAGRAPGQPVRGPSEGPT